MTVRAPDRIDDDLPLDVLRGHWSGLKRWNAAYSGIDDTTCKVLFLGDSVVVGGFANVFEERFAHVWAELQASTFRPSGSQWISVGHWLSPWVGVGHTADTSFGIGVWDWILAGTDTATITLPACDRFHLYFTGGTTLGSAEIRVNGTLVATFSTNNASLAIMRYDSGTLDAGPKIVEVKSSSGSNIVLSGGYFWNGDYASGMHVWDVGHSGYDAGDIADFMLGRAGAVETNMALKGEYIGPDLVIVETGFNDLGNGNTKATFKTDVAYIVDALRSNTDGVDPSIALLGLWARGDSTYTDAQWQPYREAMREVADEKDCVFLDLYDMFGWMGTTGDSFHAGGTTSGTSITLPTGFFRGSGASGFDIGATVTGDGITGSRTITNITSLTQATLSSAVDTNFTGNGRFTINRKDPGLLTTDGIHPSSRGHRFIAKALNQYFIPPSGNAIERINTPVSTYKSADQTTTGTTVVDDLHLWKYLKAGQEYNLELGLWVLPAATTTGPRITFTGPTMTSFKFNLNGPTGATTFGQASATALGTEVTLASLPSATIPTMLTVNVHARPSASGYLKLRIGSEVAANITYQRGSWIRTTRVL